MKRRGGGAAADEGAGGGAGAFALPVSLFAALVISSPATLAALDGRLPAPTAMTAFVAVLAAVWILGAVGTWIIDAVDRRAATRELIDLRRRSRPGHDDPA